MSDEALLAYRNHVLSNMHQDYGADVVLVLLNEIISWRREFGTMAPAPPEEMDAMTMLRINSGLGRERKL